MPQTKWLKQQKSMVPQLWRPEPETKVSAGRAFRPLKVPGKDVLEASLSASGSPLARGSTTRLHPVWHSLCVPVSASKFVRTLVVLD